MSKSKGYSSTRLFREIEGQDNLFVKSVEQEVEEEKNKPVTCLGITFENDEERRKYFLDKLKEKLQDPEFRKIEGFPIGTDEAILALSDPPYYTACPNPWVADFVKEWEKEKPIQIEPYHREPFAADVSEGKNHPIYNAHSYHTKVPHKAIMRYILHYTNPGDIVFDGFCGTGMTGIAAQMCGDRDAILELGYQVKPNGTVLQEDTDELGKKYWRAFSKLGVRHAILNDLSPSASFIAYNYNTPTSKSNFLAEANKIIGKIEAQLGWMYNTCHTDGRNMGKINYIVWSDVFVCPNCSGDIVFWESAVDKITRKMKDEFNCPHCTILVSKDPQRNNSGIKNQKKTIATKLERAWTIYYDKLLAKNLKQYKQVPVLINYTYGGKRFEKAPDDFDINLLLKIENTQIENWVPTSEIPVGEKTPEVLRLGLFNHHHLYTYRALHILSKIYSLSNMNLFRLSFQSIVSTLCSKMVRYNFGNRGNGILTGTIYVPSLFAEANVLKILMGKVQDISKAIILKERAVLSNGSCERIISEDESVDYIFIDPPFGKNLQYSELNLFWEAWLNIFTNNTSEAIESKSQKKDVNHYRTIMFLCFKEAYRVLKSGHWITIEFSNTKAAIWNNIQTALSEAGFIVANVSVLDKKQGSYNAVTNTTSVKQDLVISAYKPNLGFEEQFAMKASGEDGVWSFVRTHLNYLPVVKLLNTQLQLVGERDSRILFDQMVAYYVRKGFDVPISSQEFQKGLALRFVERDGMYFLPEQAAEYDKKRMLASELGQMSIFVSDEATAVQWLRQLLKTKPQTFADINPQFMQQLAGWNKNEKLLDLRELLAQNFLCFEGRDRVPEQIHTYLSSNWKELRNLPKDHPDLLAKAKDRWYVPDPNKQADLDKLRERSLLEEFKDYLPEELQSSEATARALKTKQQKRKSSGTGKRLRVFRLEALRAGFKHCWQNKDYKTIVAVATRIPEDVLQEDPKLLMWYDQAKTRLGE